MQIDFYNLGAANFAALQRYSCRLLDKAYRQKEAIFVLCNNEQDAEQLDELLWTYDDIAFIPHTLADKVDEPAPIKIGWDSQQKQQNSILLNMSDNVPENYQEFSRVLELVLMLEPWHSRSKEKYRLYKSASHEPVVHHIKNL